MELRYLDTEQTILEQDHSTSNHKIQIWSTFFFLFFRRLSDHIILETGLQG